MFPFNFDKALQAAAYLLRRERSREMNYMRLIKVLYMADRESIRLTGHLITGGRISAMKQGPVLSGVLDLIKSRHLRAPEWAEFIERDEYKVRLIKDPGLANLSRFEVETLERVAEEYRTCDEWDMVEQTHKHCAEWKKHAPRGSSLVNEIPLIDLLDAVGRSEDRQEIEDEAKVESAFARLFGG